MPAPFKNAPLCLRLPDDLHVAVAQLAQESGMNTSEWMRHMLIQIVYGTPPNIEEGYIQGRRIGLAVVMRVIRDAVADNMPETVEEAMPLTQLGSPGRRPHDR